MLELPLRQLPVLVEGSSAQRGNQYRMRLFFPGSIDKPFQILYICSLRFRKSQRIRNLLIIMSKLDKQKISFSNLFCNGY